MLKTISGRYGIWLQSIIDWVAEAPPPITLHTCSMPCTHSTIQFRRLSPQLQCGSACQSTTQQEEGIYTPVRFHALSQHLPEQHGRMKQLHGTSGTRCPPDELLSGLPVPLHAHLCTHGVGLQTVGEAPLVQAVHLVRKI